MQGWMLVLGASKWFHLEGSELAGLVDVKKRSAMKRHSKYVAIALAGQLPVGCIM